MSKLISKNNFLEKLPEEVEIFIFSHIEGFCHVCDIFQKHPMETCAGCETNICLKADGVWTTSNGKIVCQKCRHEKYKCKKFILKIN